MKTYVLKNYVAIASRPVFNDAAIVIYDVEYGIEDAILVGDVYGDTRKTPHFIHLHYDAQGDAYFMHHGQREYLRDYVRINYPD